MKLEEKHTALFNEITKILRKYGKLEEVVFDGKDREDLYAPKDTYCVCDIFDSIMNFLENEND